ncbi:MAG TPA: type 1 glutamine amidotransferase domain-containing protein, partial [Gemmatimonadaceae bacterium]
MPRNDLIGKRVAILATDGVEAVELIDPRNALDKVGAKTLVVSPNHDKIRSWQRGEWADDIPIDLPLAKVSPDDFEALFLPGGVINADRLRLDVQAVQFVRHFFETGKPVAAICHAPWILIEANVVRNRTLTSWPSLQTDLRNAGADWVDREVVSDMGLVTSRGPADLSAFIPKVIEEFEEGIHPGQRMSAEESQTPNRY